MARTPWAHARLTFGGLAMIVRAGATFLGLGIAGDVAYHATHGLRPHSHTPGAFDIAMVIHLTVVVGMTMCMVGVVQAGIRSVRSARIKGGDNR